MRQSPATKRSAIVHQQMGVLGVTFEGTDMHHTKMLRATIEAIVVQHPEPTEENPQHLCSDARYDNPTARRTATAHRYVSHIRAIRKEKPIPRGPKRHKPRRRVVERLMAWPSQCRAILARYDNNSFNDVGLFPFACGPFCFRRLYRMGVA